jgi:hypothetical protein
LSTHLRLGFSSDRRHQEAENKNWKEANKERSLGRKKGAEAFHPLLDLK